MSVLRWWGGLVLAFALLAALRVVLPLPFANEIVIFSVYTIGCSFLLGRVGFISFGQPAYLAVGAYAAAFYLYYLGTNAYLAILIGIVAGFVVALAVGPLFVRLRSDYFALVNLALAVIIYYLMQKVLADVTHGDNGLWFLTNLTPTPVLDLSRPDQFFIFALLVAFAVWALYKYLDDTLFGACCLAVKINEDKLRFLGYDSFGIRLAAFVIANTTTALAGAMYAVYLGFVSPEITSPARAADPVVVTILGGAGTLYGPIIGSIAYTGMKDLISQAVGNWELFVGFLLVFVMLAGEKGIWGTLEPLLRKLISRARAAARMGEAEIKVQMMDMHLITSGVIFGLSMGSVFFLMSIGLSLCFGLMRVISLDQLLYYSIGAYITYSIGQAIGNMWLGVLGGVVVGGLAGLAVERLIFLRIYERDITFSMITSFGILIGGVGVIKALWGVVPRPVSSPIDGQVDILGTEIPTYRLVVVAIALAVYLGIWLFLNRTIIGKAIRAGIEDVEHVEGLGINVYRLFSITFVLAGALSGLAGGLHAPLIMVDPQMGIEVLAFAFMIVIIGGLGSIKGTLVSAFLVGQVVSLGSLVYAPLAQMAPFAIMMLILLLKPTGLYGSPLLKR